MQQYKYTIAINISPKPSGRPRRSHSDAEVDLHRLDVRVAREVPRQLRPNQLAKTIEREGGDTHFANAYSPSSRPIPDCLYPPNGTFGYSML